MTSWTQSFLLFIYLYAYLLLAAISLKFLVFFQKHFLEHIFFLKFPYLYLNLSSEAIDIVENEFSSLSLTNILNITH